MKKVPFLLFLTLLTVFLFIACSGDLQVVKLEVLSGLKTEYTVGDTPDFSDVTAKASYSDGTVKSLSASELKFSSVDTSVVGEKQLIISYGNCTLSVTINVKGKELGNNTESNQIITAVSLPDSLTLWNANKQDFINQNYTYNVGDDNPFIFTLKLSVYSQDGEKLNVSSYTSASYVYLQGSDMPLVNEELKKYVEIDEDKNSFDFTDEAVGKTFTISTRPRYGVEGYEEEMTKHLTVTVVDGYNIYKAYELNYITNATGFEFGAVHEGDNRNQLEVVNDFLRNEKNATRPESFSGIILHSNLDITPTDIPAEYFVNKSRDNDFYDYLSVFHHVTSAKESEFTLYGNYFAIYASKLPAVVGKDQGGNQDDDYSSTNLFKFSTTDDRENYKNNKTTVKNLMLMGDDPQSDNLENSEKAMRGITAIKTDSLTVTLDNTNIQAFCISYFADYDYQNVTINDSIFYNAWQNHIFLITKDTFSPSGPSPERLTVSIENSSIKQCGGPAIISQSRISSNEPGIVSGAIVNISDDTEIESWVTGEEAWFKAMGITIVAEQLKKYESSVNKYDSSFIREKVVTINNQSKIQKQMNVILVNLMFPDMSNGWQGMLDIMMGTSDIDGKLIINGKTVMDMDDHIKDTEIYKFGNKTTADIKADGADNHVFETQNGVAYTSPGSQFTVKEGDISAKSDSDYLTIYFYTLGIVLGNYHPL